MLKTFLFFLCISVLLAQNTFAQDISRWHLPEGAKARLGKGSIEAFAYSPDGTRLAVASSIGIYLYETATYREVALFTEQTAWLALIKFSPDGNTIAGVGDTAETETIVRLWDAKTGEHKHTLKHKGAVTSVAFSPDSTTLATGSADTGIIEDYHTTYETTLAVWDAKTGRRTQTLTGHTDLVNSVAFSPDGNTIATGDNDETLRLWDANTGILKHTLIGHTSWIYSIAFSPDGKTIATGSGDGTVLLWDVPVRNNR